MAGKARLGFTKHKASARQRGIPFSDQAASRAQGWPADQQDTESQR